MLCPKSYKVQKWALLTLVIILLAQNLYSEAIRGETVGVIKDDDKVLSFNLEEIVGINIPETSHYKQGIELQIDIPEELSRYPNSFALFLYKTVSPRPNIGQHEYRGVRVYMRLLPSGKSLFLRIPLHENHDISNDALTQLLPVAVPPDEFPLVATILPIIKGLPDSSYLQDFHIHASSLFKDEGSLSVTITNPSGIPEEIISITIDGKEVRQGEILSLKTGVHKVSVSSTHAPVTEKSVLVEAGVNTEVPITLDYRPPEIFVKFPKESQVFLDGEELVVKEGTALLEIEPGEHEISGILGEYEISKTFSVRPGSRVNITLLLDIKITEYDNEVGSPFGSGDG